MLKKTRLTAFVATSMILGTVALPVAAEDPDIHYFRITWFTDASKSQVSGYLDGYCSGNTEEHGQQTIYSTIRYFTMCP